MISNYDHKRDEDAEKNDAADDLGESLDLAIFHAVRTVISSRYSEFTAADTNSLFCDESIINTTKMAEEIIKKAGL